MTAKLDQYRHQERDSPGQDGGATRRGETAANADTTKVLEAITACQEAIAACQSTLTARIEEVKVDISLVRQDFQKLRERVTETETRISMMEDSLPPLQHSSEAIQTQVNQLLQKQDDLENRIRRCNLRFIGLPEGVEGRDPTEFLETLLCDTYGRAAFSSTFTVERAHRMSGRPPPVGAPPRTFIAKFLNYRDRDNILCLSCEKGNIPFGNKMIAVFPDFSAEVQRKRKTFTEAKRHLRIKNIKYAMLFPARLRVEGEDRAHFFEDPEAAIAWLERRDAQR